MRYEMKTSAMTLSRRPSPHGLQVDDGVGRDARKRELGRGIRDRLIQQFAAAEAGDVHRTAGIRTTNANAKPFDLAAAVVEQVQPDSGGIAGEPADDDLAAEDSQRPLVVAELTPDLEGER